MALSMARAATTDPSSSNNSPSPSTPLRESSSGRAAITEIRTPVASSSFLENDSPLPPPPSIFKTAGTYAPLQFGGSGRASDEDDGDKENAQPTRTRSTSPTPAFAPLRSKGRHSGHEDGSKNALVPASQRSPRAKSLAEALGAPAPPSAVSSHRHPLEHKLGIRPAAGSSRTAVASGARSVSHASGARLLPRHESESPASMPRATTSHARIASHGVHFESRSSRPLPSALSRSRDGTEEREESQANTIDVDEAGDGKQRSPEGTTESENGSGSGHPVPLFAQHDRAKPDYNGKLSAGSDSGEKSSSPPRGPVEGRHFDYATPALAAGSRSMRSAQTATAGRSTGRTLRRYGVGEARPMHVRPARVMLVQGADDTDGEDEEEGNAVADAVAMQAVGSSKSAGSNSGSLKEVPSSAEGTPRSQASSNLLDGISTQATKADSPLTRHPSDALEIKDRVRTDSGARRRRPLATEGQNARPTASARPNGRVLTEENLARKPSAADSGAHDGRGPGRSLGSHLRPANAQTAAGPSHPETSSNGNRPSRHDHPQPHADDLKQAVEGALGAKVAPLPPLERSRGVTHTPSNPAPRSIRQATPPTSRPDAGEEALPRVTDQRSPGFDRERIAEIEPEIEAEKRRLLELNGWDRYVHAALEEGQRQRHNGCQFAEHPVGKVLATQKETKFRGAKYLKVSRAGEGGFSTVFQVVGPVAVPTVDGGFEPVPAELQAHFAMKQVSLKKLEQSSRDELLQEAELLETLAQVDESDKYVLRYFGHKHSGDTLKILMELGEMDFNTLLRTQHPLSRQSLSEYWKQMLEAVHFVHNAKLVHSDLKPANFLMVKGRIKLIDFGIAQKIPLGTVHISRDVIVGTPNYMAPEAIQKARRGGHGVYKAGKPSDVWSLGCILYQMIYGRTPFAHISGDRKLEVITNAKHTIAFPNRRTLDDSAQQSAERDAQDEEKEGDAEELDEILINCVKSALVYDSQLRAKIPQLLDHLFVRDEVTLSRKRLKSIVFRIKSYMQQGRLTDDNVDVIADRLVTNLQLDGFRPFDPEQD